MRKLPVKLDSRERNRIKPEFSARGKIGLTALAFRTLYEIAKKISRSLSFFRGTASLASYSRSRNTVKKC